MRSFSTAIAVIAFSLSLAQAQEAPQRPTPPQQQQQRSEGLPPLPANVTTRHKLELPGRSLEFAATAGTIRLFDANTGSPHADMAFIAFTREGPARERPVTFIFNGGPGYASAWLHLGALGQTWLDFTGLGFLDPAGTGYSRVLGNEEVRKSLWSINGDANSLAVTIRRWVQANGREQSPKFILRESYGGFRAPKIAHILQTDQGIGVNGLVLVAPVLDFGRFDQRNSVLSHVARLPAFAAVARERKGAITRDNLQDIEAYARGEFLADLMRGVNDREAIERLTKRVSDLTGLDATLVRRLGARIPVEVFAREINRDQQRVSSLYDGNATGLDPAPFSAGNHAEDQLRLGLHAPITQAMVELYRIKLNWVVENGRYQFMNEQAGRQWDRGRGAESVSDLRQAMALDPKLRVLVAHGLTDLVTPYFETRMVLDQVPDFGTPDRIRFETYAGGHMLYFREASRIKFREDGRKLMDAR